MRWFIYTVTMILHYIAKIFNSMCKIQSGVTEYVDDIEIF